MRTVKQVIEKVFYQEDMKSVDLKHVFHLRSTYDVTMDSRFSRVQSNLITSIRTSLSGLVKGS